MAAKRGRPRGPMSDEEYRKRYGRSRAEAQASRARTPKGAAVLTGLAEKNSGTRRSPTPRSKAPKARTAAPTRPDIEKLQVESYAQWRDNGDPTGFATLLGKYEPGTKEFDDNANLVAGLLSNSAYAQEWWKRIVESAKNDARLRASWKR